MDRRLNPLIAVAVIFCAVTRCGTLPNGRTWGQDAIYPVDLGGIPHAAYDALVNMQTWLPLAGAVTVAPFDRKVSVPPERLLRKALPA
ncbi:MAG: hypothetical protein ABSD38_32610 [Syntrophorhabdales bacterium]|jgi:hypothetical protein